MPRNPEFSCATCNLFVPLGEGGPHCEALPEWTYKDPTSWCGWGQDRWEVKKEKRKRIERYQQMLNDPQSASDRGFFLDDGHEEQQWIEEENRHYAIVDVVRQWEEGLDANNQTALYGSAFTLVDRLKPILWPEEINVTNSD